WLRVDDDVNEPHVGISKLAKHTVTEVDNPAGTYKPAVRPTVGDRDPDCALRWGIQQPGINLETDANASAQRIKPRRRCQLVGVEPLTIGHEFAAVLLAVPR